VIPAVGPWYGGPSVAIRGMTRALAALGAQVEVATTDANGPTRLAVPTDVPVDEEGVAYHYFGTSLPGEWKFSWPLTRWLARNISRFDVVHVHALFSYSTIPACRLARRSGVPYVVRPLGTLAAWSLRQHAWKKRPYLALVERPHLRKAAAIHVTSDAEAEIVRALGYEHTATIPLGVELPPDDRTALPERRGEPLRLLFLSRLHPKKNVDLLLDACALVEDGRSGHGWELVVAGQGDAGYVDALRAHARKLGIANRVRFVGQLEGASKAAAIGSADVFVLPSSDENFGIAAAEALAAGLPVILSDQVALAPDVLDAGAGLVVSRDARAIASAILELAADPTVRARMRVEARRLAHDQYSWERTGIQLASLYARVTGRAIDSRAPSGDFLFRTAEVTR
jgi:glycosyltransferase involved in cell wall biosynthesis